MKMKIATQRSVGQAKNPCIVQKSSLVPPISSRSTKIKQSFAIRFQPHRQAFTSQTFFRSRQTITMARSTLTGSPSSNQLLICGPGVLGSYFATLWLNDFGSGTVVGQTNTTNNHAVLTGLGITPRTKADAAQPPASLLKFPFVVYSAPPSGSEDYVGDVKAALKLWDGTGSFVFTSSASLYAVEDGSECDETAPLVQAGANPRTDVLLAAEQAVIDAGGSVVRLVGLYHRTRGAHTFFLKQGQVPRWAGYTVNLIHYEDAASLTHAILRGQGNGAHGFYRGRVFLGCDNHPITFGDMMSAVVASGQLGGNGCEFTGPESPVKGKRMNNNATRKELGWEPKYAQGIQGFFRDGAMDWYAACQGAQPPTGAPHT